MKETQWIEGQSLTFPDDGEVLWKRLGALHSKVSLPSPFVLQVVLKRHMSGFSSVFIRVGDPSGTCNVTGLPLPWWGRKFYISPHMTDGEIVQTVFLACKVAMEHELREGFKYKGQAIFDPHYDIEKLVELRASEGALKEREDA